MCGPELRIFGRLATIAVDPDGTYLSSFACDANGNLVSGAGRTWSWTAANRPRDITQASQTTSFTYGPERQRIKQTVTQGASTIKTIHYAGAMQKDIAGGSTVVRTYLPLDLGVIVEAGGTSAVRYFHRDRLGSVIALTDEAGAVRERHAYDAWGKRRNADGSDAAGNLSSAIDDTGYTGHEMLDALGLVHMNGRLYDPLTGRMQSADPLVPDPADPQSFNRYAYVLNNPLAYTDPSGFSGAGTGTRTCTASSASDAEALNCGNPAARQQHGLAGVLAGFAAGVASVTAAAGQTLPRVEVSGMRWLAGDWKALCSGSTCAHAIQHASGALRVVGATMKRGAAFVHAVAASPAARGGGLGIGIAAGLELTAGAQRDPITDSLVFNEMNTGNGENDAGQLTTDGADNASPVGAFDSDGKPLDRTKPPPTGWKPTFDPPADTTKPPAPGWV